ncbi:MAG TPA: hypothetical protein VF753_11930 [Terriglobales bacterium]
MAAKWILPIALFALPFAATAQTGNCTQVDASTRPECSGAIDFFHNLQSAMQKNDRQAIAGMVDYPMSTSLNHRRVRVRSAQQLLAHFDKVFDKGVRCSILGATDKDVWGNWQGFTVSDGAVWFDVIIPASAKPDVSAADYWKKYPFKIKTINSNGDYACAAQSSTTSPSPH